MGTPQAARDGPRGTPAMAARTPAVGSGPHPSGRRRRRRVRARKLPAAVPAVPPRGHARVAGGARREARGAMRDELLHFIDIHRRTVVLRNEVRAQAVTGGFEPYRILR